MLPFLAIRRDGRRASPRFAIAPSGRYIGISDSPPRGIIASWRLCDGPVTFAGRAGTAVFVCYTLACIALPVAADELVDVVKRVENAVVRIDTDQALGSGVVVDDRGYVFTNYHVIEDATRVTIKLRSGEEVKALGFVAIDVGRNLALLKTDPLKPCGIRIAKKPPSIGEKVAAFGNPQGYEFSTTEGIVSASERAAM